MWSGHGTPCRLLDELASPERIVFMLRPRYYIAQKPLTGHPRIAAATYHVDRFLDQETVRQQVEAVATTRGMEFRVGDEADAVHGDGTVPVVLWNPEVVRL